MSPLRRGKFLRLSASCEEPRAYCHRSKLVCWSLSGGHDCERLPESWREQVLSKTKESVNPISDQGLRDHRSCFVCGADNPEGLALKFSSRADGSVSARFECAPRFQGYPDRLHGGVVVMLLDDAMVNCLLREGVPAVTGRLNVSFRKPVRLEKIAEVRAHVVSRTKSLYVVKAELYQDGRLMAHGEGKFMDEKGAILPVE